MSLYLESGCGGPCAPCHDCEFYGYQTATTCPAGKKPVATAVTDTPSTIAINCTTCQPVSCLDLRQNIVTCAVNRQLTSFYIPGSFGGYSSPVSEEQCLALIALANEVLAPCDALYFALDAAESEDYFGITCYFCNVFNDADI